MDKLEDYKSGLITLDDIKKGLSKREKYFWWSNLVYKVIRYELENNNASIAYMLLSEMAGDPGLEDTTDWYKKLFSYNNKKLIKYEILKYFGDQLYIMDFVRTSISNDKIDLMIKVLYELKYDLEKLVIRIFDSTYYQQYILAINEIINYTGIEWIKNSKYIDKNDRLKEWYYNLILNQV